DVRASTSHRARARRQESDPCGSVGWVGDLGGSGATFLAAAEEVAYLLDDGLVIDDLLSRFDRVGLEQFACLGAQALGNDDVGGDDEVAAARFAQARHAFPAQPELRGGLRAGRDAQVLLAVQRRYCERGTQGGLSQTQVESIVQLVALTLEQGVWFHLDVHVQVARQATVGARVAGVRHAQAVAAVDTARESDVDLVVDEPATPTFTYCARVGDYLTFALTIGARPAGDDGAEQGLRLAPDLARSATACACLLASSTRFGPLAAAVFAGGIALYSDLDGLAGPGLLERHLESDFEVLAGPAAAALPARHGAAHPADHRREYVEDVGSHGDALVDAAVPVVPGALLWIAEDRVRLVERLELLLGSGVARVAIGVVTER